jgi:S1-C subfamily serine protease
MDLPGFRFPSAVGIAATVVVLTSCGGSKHPSNPVARAAAKAGHAVNPAVVAVEARIGTRSVQASGFVIDGDAGLVLTSAHDIWGATSLRLTTALGILHGRLVARAPCEDIAVIQTEPRIPGFPTLPPAPATSPADGQLLRVIGRVGDPRLSGAYVMAGIPVRPMGTVHRVALDSLLPPQPAAIPLDTELVPDVSGGAVVDAAGRLVGMAQAVSGSNRALLVPWSRLHSILAELHPGKRAVYNGWAQQYRCAAQLQAFARKTYPGYNPLDARLNAPVHASRVPGTERLDG